MRKGCITTNVDSRWLCLFSLLECAPSKPFQIDELHLC